MELVRGLPSTSTVRTRLTIRERLELFLLVCHGAHHAASEGYHSPRSQAVSCPRTSYEGGTVPKIIDFGIAKAVAGQHSRTRPFTRLMASLSARRST